MLLNQDQDLLADLSIAICSSYISSKPVLWSQSVVHIEDDNSTVESHIGKVVCILARSPTDTAASVGVDDTRSLTLAGKELRITVFL